MQFHCSNCQGVERVNENKKEVQNGNVSWGT